MLTLSLSFIKDFSQKDFDDLVDGWKIKVDRVNAGDQAWGLFLATKKA
jgi:phosphoethanolamine N-methyltransferase